MSCQKIKWDSSGTSVDWGGSKTYKVSWIGCSETPDDPVDPDPTCADSVITAIDGVTKSISNTTSAGLDGLVAKAGVTPTSVIINSGNKIPYNTGLELECGSNVKLFTDVQIGVDTTVVETVFRKTDYNNYYAGRYGTTSWSSSSPAAFRVQIIRNGNTNSDRSEIHSKYITFANLDSEQNLVNSLNPNRYCISEEQILVGSSIKDTYKSAFSAITYTTTQIDSTTYDTRSQVITVENSWCRCMVNKTTEDVTMYNIIFLLSNVTDDDIIIITQYGRMCLSNCGANYLNIMSGHFTATHELPCLFYATPKQIFIWRKITDWYTNNATSAAIRKLSKNTNVYCVGHIHSGHSNTALADCNITDNATVNFQATGGTIEQYLLANKNNSIDNLV